MKKGVPSHLITPERVYLSRRQFIAAAGAVAALALLPSACKGRATSPTSTGATTSVTPSGTGTFCDGSVASAATDELGGKLTSCEDVINYNNFYEFSYLKTDVAPSARNFKTTPWAVEVGGMVSKPRTFAMEDIPKLFPPEERIYRMRCVEGWSMVIPWNGFPLSKLLKEVDPLSTAKYVRFEAVFRPDEMPNQNDNLLTWPYLEGLRMDEAMNDLTILATGVYGKPLPIQNGAPIRLMAPWKYGFKNIKSIVKIDLVDQMPRGTWQAYAPEEYGFYANVNPNVDHPRWSQASERRISENRRIETLLFNGYDKQVGDLYKGLDLRTNY